jgi:hypothetical protein
MGHVTSSTLLSVSHDGEPYRLMSFLGPGMNMRKYRICEAEGLFLTGHFLGGVQVLMGFQQPELVCLRFSDSGEFIGLETRPVRQHSNDMEAWMQAKGWLQELGGKVCEIQVERFSITARAIGVRDMPDYLEDFIAQPEAYDSARTANLSAYIRDWTAQKRFVLQWDEEYEMDTDGNVLSS